MTTYSNLKMKDTFILFGNPFSRKNCKKNCFLTLCKKYHKRIDFKAQINVKNLSELNNYSRSFISINNLNNSNLNGNIRSNISNNSNNSIHSNTNNNNFNIITIHKKKNNNNEY
jgi:hypothetical protein